MKLKTSLLIQEDFLRAFLSDYGKHNISTEDLVKEYLNIIKEHWADILSSLQPLELFCFMETFIKDGLDIEILTKQISSEILQEAILNLEKTGLCVQRINIKYLKETKKLYIFQEIRDFFVAEENLLSFKSFFSKLEEINYLTTTHSMKEISEDIFHLFYSYGFYVPKTILEQTLAPEALEYLHTSGLIKPVLLIYNEVPDNTKSYFCYTLVNIKQEIQKKVLGQRESLQSEIINSICRLVFAIQKDGIKITKKDDMSRKSLEKFCKIIPQESLLYFLLHFLKNKGFLEMVDEFSLYKVSDDFFVFFKQDLQHTYKELLKIDSCLQDLLNIFKGFKESYFSFADILVSLLQKKPEIIKGYFDSRDIRRSFLQKLELLHYLGIVDRLFTPNGMSFYSISTFYQNAINFHNLPKPILTISSSFQIMGDSSNISSQLSYILSIFGDIESLSPMLVFKITQETVHRALYFGFKVEDFINVLNHYSKVTLEANMLKSLESWSQSFKHAFLEEGLILHAPVNVLDEIEFKREYSIYIKKRIAPTYAIVSSELKSKKLLDKSFIFFATSKKTK